MSSPTGSATTAETGASITVHYWAAARAAAGVASDELSVAGPTPLTEVIARATARHPDGRLREVLGMCSVLVGDLPVSGGDRDAAMVAPGQAVEFLPPFAGG